MCETIALGSMFAGMGVLILSIVISVGLINIFLNRRSYDYRKLITDMYISGKIRQFADTEDISISEELKRFAKITKNEKIGYENLDETIERQMQEKINQQTTDKEEVKQ